MRTTHTVSQPAMHVQRFARLFGKLSSQRAFVCPFCSVVLQGDGPAQFGPLCLLREPSDLNISHHMCKDCFHQWMACPDDLEIWAHLRRFHNAREKARRNVRQGGPDDAA